MRAGRPVEHRLVALDRLRGLALIGVAIVNLMVFAADAGAGLADNPFERRVSWLRDVFLNGKCYPALAMLFGYSLGLQLRRAGSVHAHRHTVKRRLLGLCALGLAHGLLLYRYDILLAYAALGLVAYHLRQRSTPFLLTSVAVLLVVGGLAMSVVSIDTRGLARIGPSVAVQRYRSGDLVGLLDLHLRNFASNLSTEALLQWPQTLGMILFGVLAERFDAVRRLTRFGRRSMAVVGLVAAGFTVLATLHGAPTSSFGVFVLALSAPLLWFGAAAGVLWWVDRKPSAPFLDAFGRMTLTNYLGQSLIFTLTLYGCGLGLWRFFRPSVQVVFALLVVSAQMVASRWWLSRHDKGPIEAVLARWSNRAAALRRAPSR